MKRTVWFVLSVAVLLISLNVPISGYSPSVLAQGSGLDVVQTDAGLVAATRDSTPTVHAYKMIPFASPPVGDLRWKLPQPVAPWQGVRRAEWFSPMCMQPKQSSLALLYSVEQAVSEDCLYLNVWTPAKAGSDKLPVMVWVYGGSNITGSGSDVRFEGADLTKKGVVVVTFNYRGGIFGWLAHPDLTKESGNLKFSGNYGLLDQIAALKWVQKNIAAFGGEPNNVTLFGQSAGSRNISLLTVSPLAKGLFHRAIAESTSAMAGGFGLSGTGTNLLMRLPEAEKAFDSWVKKNYSASSIAEMRAKSAWDLMKVAPSSAPQTTIVDGYVIPDYFDTLYAQGKQNDVPLLTGWNKDEGTMFAPMATKVVSYTAAAQTRYGKFADQFLKTYPATTDAEALAQSYAASREIYGRGLWAWARARAATGKTSTFMYYWTYAPPWLPGVKFEQQDPATKLGAYHGSEIPYVFFNLEAYADQRKYTDGDAKLADTLSSYWTNFAKTGNPNGPGLPTWPEFDDKAANPIMYLGTEIKPGPLPNRPGLDFFDAWASSLLPAKQ